MAERKLTPKIVLDEAWANVVEVRDREGESPLYEYKLKIYRDLRAVIDTAYSDGVKEAMMKGILEVKLEAAQKLKHRGLSIDIIVKVTGLSIAELNDLQPNINSN